VAMWSSSDPVNVDLVDLEAGESLDDNHVRIGEHCAVFGAAVYEYEESRADIGPAKVNHLFYPVISTKKMLDLVDGSDAVELEQFSMMIRTSRFKTVDEADFALEKVAELEGEIEGLVVNQFGEGLDSEEEELIRENFPKLDLDNVVIVSEGHPVPTIWAGLIAMVIGSFFFFGGIFLMISGDQTAMHD